MRTIAVFLTVFMLICGSLFAAEEPSQFAPSAIQKLEAIQARAFMDNSKISPLMFVTAPMPMSHSTPKEVLGEIAAGRNVYLVDLQAALAYFDTLVAKAKETKVTAPALTNLRKKVASITPPKPGDVVVAELGQGFYIVALPPYSTIPIDTLTESAKEKLTSKGLVVKGAVIISNSATPKSSETPQFLVLFAESPPGASKSCTRCLKK